MSDQQSSYLLGMKKKTTMFLDEPGDSFGIYEERTLKPSSFVSLIVDDFKFQEENAKELGLAELIVQLEESLDMEEIIKSCFEIKKLSLFMDMTLGSSKVPENIVDLICTQAFVHLVDNEVLDSAVLILSTY